MLQKFKNVFLGLLFVGMACMLLIQKRHIDALKENNESIIDSLKSVVIKEESLIDSFSVVRSSIKEQRDSSISVLDTIGIFSLNKILKQNIYDYAKNNTRSSIVLEPIE